MPGSLWSRVVEQISVPSIDQIELFNHLNEHKQMNNVKSNKEIIYTNKYNPC